MAKYEARLYGDFDTMLQAIDREVLGRSVSARYEDGSDILAGAQRCAVRVYERYSMVGSNRVSLSVTLVADGDGAFLSAITSGGSQAVLFKVNTLGESSFLKVLMSAVQPFTQER
jgi:Family of unknown function (DUF6054)